MANLHNLVTGWTDLAQSTRFRNRCPTTLILADEIANGEWDGLLGDVFKGEVNRPVVYVDEDGSRWYMELTLYIHPVGAGALTIRSAGASTCRGKFITELGAYTTTAPIDSDDIAGGMLSQYSETSGEIGSDTVREPAWSTTIQEGDALWIVRRGRYFALSDSDAACNDDANVVVDDSNGVDGAVQDAAAMSTPNAAEILQNIPGHGGQNIGRFREDGGTTVAGFTEMDLHLPHRYSAP